MSPTDDEVVARLRRMPFDFAARWCEPGPNGCACIGCANGSEAGAGRLAAVGVTRDQWNRCMKQAFRDFLE